MLNFNRDICDLLESRASSGRAAFVIVENLFAKIITILRRDSHFAGTSLFELELMFADARREAESALFREMRDRIHIDDAQDAVRCCLPDERED
jgi:hypothetical protein